MLPAKSPAAALICAERICAAIADLKLGTSDAFFVQTTVGTGLSGFDDHDAPSLTTLYGQADQAVYVAKHQGRNRVIEFEKIEGLTELSVDETENAEPVTPESSATPHGHFR